MNILFVRYAPLLGGISLKLVLMVKQADDSLPTEYATISCELQPDLWPGPKVPNLDG